ncbi:hypothetical protein KBZ21_38840, partial [Streptomyces sp. A73]|nr:hypothetical protein [Streptomyces sp. A73]
RERFRTAVYQAIERGDDPAEAAMAVADAEQAELRAERDRARSPAVALENQLAAVRGLHVDSYTTRGVGRGTDTPPDYWTPYCT